MARYRANVAILLLDAEERVLICERAKIPDAWQFPQGGVDKGESLEDALFREVREEIGLPPWSYQILRFRHGYLKSDERNHPTELFTTQKTAVSYGREIAKAMKADLVIRTNINTLG